ncbi:hypothetical protein BGZ61DRAFT_2792 [Ilyonectria robusta]|uniref:uncharacterized protein n=1 Tax=Ilyonectria robusta TaxID=1079257 RepID=UPI001E8D2B9A|nr:uncharacterized protein BGZ61DRAFT_2792 [Ilyonectria robusta]KAH8736765.1 hypothetical protein BGZ61DRAFT_2792 [Ilyonectria robusta]
MDPNEFSAADIAAYRANFTVAEDQHEHFQQCWSHQNCDGCLDTARCSWCPYTWSCVPNSHLVPALAPAYDENICPHWAERWEIRTRPLGCHVSTITTLTTIVTIASTLAFVGLVFGLVLGIRRLRRYNKEHPGWWRLLRRRWWSALRRRGGEEEPLLGEGHRPGQANGEVP